jgi:hypothetical protein
MDNVDRMYRHLVRTIRAKFPQYLAQPFDVSELHQTILPYRLHRRELGLETNEDYEITLTELLSGSRDYLIVDDAIRSELRAQLASNNPDPSAFKQFGGSHVALSPVALRSLEAGPDDPTTPLRTPTVPAPERPAPPLADTQPVSAQAPAQPAAPPPVPSSKPTTAPSGARAISPKAGEHCRSCNELLPPGRPITFCPHCGQNVTTVNCPACGSELEVGWKFCPVCGRPAGR